EQLRWHRAGQIEPSPDRARGRKKAIDRRQVHAPRLPRRVGMRQDAPPALASTFVVRLPARMAWRARGRPLPPAATSTPARAGTQERTYRYRIASSAIACSHRRAASAQAARTTVVSTSWGPDIALLSRRATRVPTKRPKDQRGVRETRNVA